MPDFLGISQNMMQIMSPPKRQFLYYTPVNFMIADLLGVVNTTGFFSIHIAGLMAMLAAILVSLTKKFPLREDRILFIALLSLTPLWLITLKWIGKPDPLLIGILFLCWAYPGKWRWLLASLLVVIHREMGIFMCLFLGLSEAKRDYTLIRSILLGWFFHYVYDHKILDHPPVSRVDDITSDILVHPKEFVERPVLYFLTSLSWYWGVVIWQRPAPRLCLGLAASFGIAMLSEDFTRDFILLALAPILVHLEAVIKAPSAEKLLRFLPLGLIQLQVAAMGIIYKPGNFWVDWYNGHLWDQFFQ